MTLALWELISLGSYLSQIEVRYPTDIELKTKNLVKGTIDTVQLRVLDLDARSHNKRMNYKIT